MGLSKKFHGIVFFLSPSHVKVLGLSESFLF